MPKDQIRVKVARAFIGLGSNIEPRIEYICEAIKSLGKIGEIVLVSSIYETAPVGGVDQPDFLNAVVELKATLDPIELVQNLKMIESGIGRAMRPRWHEREIDLDLLFYNDLILDTTDLIIPHSELYKRAFVLVPMTEIAPTFVHPLLKRSVSDLLNEIGSGGVKKTELNL